MLLTTKQSMMLPGHLLPEKTGETIKLREPSSLPALTIAFPSCVSLCFPLEKVNGQFSCCGAKSVFKKCGWLCGGKELSSLIIGSIDCGRTDVAACLSCECLPSNEYGALPRRRDTLSGDVLVLYVEGRRMWGGVKQDWRSYCISL